MSILAALPVIGEVVGGFLERRHERKMADLERRAAEQKVQAEISIAKTKAQTERAAIQQSANVEWSSSAQANSGWRDDAITAWFLVLLTAHFVPGSEPFIAAGWANLALMPDFMAIVLSIVLTAAFGVNAFGQYRKLVKGKD